MKLYILSIYFLLICCLQRILEVLSTYRDAKKGHVVAKWTINVLAFIFFVFVLCSFFEVTFFHKKEIQKVIFFICVIIYGIELLFRFWCIRSLKNLKSYNIEIRHQHRVIREGPYRYIRHPIYLGMILESILIPFSVQAYVTLLIPLFFYIPLLIYRMIIEEKVLGKLSGTQYKRYILSTPAIFPKIGGQK